MEFISAIELKYIKNSKTESDFFLSIQTDVHTASTETRSLSPASEYWAYIFNKIHKIYQNIFRTNLRIHCTSEYIIPYKLSETVKLEVQGRIKITYAYNLGFDYLA